jgi:hypothetical protein
LYQFIQLTHGPGNQSATQSGLYNLRNGNQSIGPASAHTRRSLVHPIHPVPLRPGQPNTPYDDDALLSILTLLPLCDTVAVALARPSGHEVSHPATKCPQSIAPLSPPRHLLPTTADWDRYSRRRGRGCSAAASHVATGGRTEEGFSIMLTEEENAEDLPSTRNPCPTHSSSS